MRDRADFTFTDVLRAMPTVVDFAYQIVKLHEDNEDLRRERDHFKEMHKDYMKSLNRSIANSEEMIGTLLSAAFDPDSVINKGHEAITKEQLKKAGLIE